MAKYIQDGKIINFRNTTEDAIRYEDVIVLTDRIGVAAMDIPAGGLGTVAVDGVFQVPAETTSAFAVGQTVYWDKPNGRVTATKAESGPVMAGMVVEAKASATASALIKL